jgi:hypothetical protein
VPQFLARLTEHKTAVQQVLDGTISDKGILAPMNSKINGPLMRELKEKYGSVFLGSSVGIRTDGELRIECKEKILT